MKSIYDSRQRLKFVFIFTAILIAIASLVVSDMLIKDLAQEERQKMEVWAEATRLTASKNTAVDLSLVLKILEGNTTIPVVLCNDKDSIMFVKNISFPENDVEEFKKVKVLPRIGPFLFEAEPPPNPNMLNMSLMSKSAPP